MGVKKLFLILLAAASIITAQDKHFKTDVDTDKKPWNHLNFYNDPDNFQFAIVTDRTGGHRVGIFRDAVDKLNLLMPELVVCVGDLIEGYTEDIEQLDKEWKEFNAMTDLLTVPFFYLPGNHDISNKVMQKEWEKRFGRRYYHFIYKNVLFILMDTNDGDGVAYSNEQVEYVKKVLADNPDVRWTLFFMHHPVWMYDNSDIKNMFAPVEESLGDRNYTVYAGHMHRYHHSMVNKRNYYVLATTGGGSRLRGPRFGEFDHITWITMSDNGPIMANLKLDGILPYDISDEKTYEMAQALYENTEFNFMLLADDDNKLRNGALYFNFTNTSDDSLFIDAQFFHHHQVNILQPKIEVALAPGSTKQFKVPVESAAFPYDDIYPLQLTWTMYYKSMSHFKLDGSTEIPVKPTVPKTIANKYTSFLDEVTVITNPVYEGIQVHYSTNGEVDNNSPELLGGIKLNETTGLKIRLYDEKGYSSLTEEVTFKELTPSKPADVSSPKQGLMYSYYEGDWEMIPDFESMTPKKTGTATTLDIDEVKDAKERYGFVFEGYIEAKETGFYEFYLRSDDGSRLFIDGEMVIDHDGLHSASYKYGAAALEAGMHKVKIMHFERTGGEWLEAGYKGPGDDEFKKIEKWYY